MMKKLLVVLVAVLTVSGAYAQTDVATTPTTESTWKANFYDLTHEERGALWTDPSVDQEELKTFLASLRKAPRQHTRSSGGGEFSCDAWYDHNALASETIMPEDWLQFDGGCGAGGAVDAYFGPIALPFEFCLFGQAVTEMYINTKGTITFDEPMCDWTPETLPAANYNQIAAYWADSDFTASGYVEYEILADAAIITFWDVGYYASNADLVNTFQIVVTNGGSSVLGAGFNVGFLFQDMQWAHGDVGGGGGFEGPTAGTIGVDDDGGTNGFQLGRFNSDSDEYDGPFNNDDGIHWLDYKSFIFSICEDPTDPSQGTPSNYPPVSSNQLGGLNGVLPDVASCDTIFICSNELQDFEVTYLAPEDDQDLTITVDDPSGVVTNINTTGTDWVNMTGQIFGNPDIQGTHEVTITITDDGSPAQTLTQTFIISILEFEAPLMEILGDSVFCSIDGTVLTVTPDDLDYYDWSFDACDGSNTCEVNFPGEVTVEGSLGPCKNTVSMTIDPSAYFIPCIDPNPAFACSGDSVLVCSCDEWAGYTWEIWDDPGVDNEGAIIYSTPSDDCVWVGPGYYVLIAEDEAGCEGVNIFQVQAGSGQDPDVPETVFCNNLDPLELFGMGPPNEGFLTVYLGTNADSFGDDFLEICVTPAGQEPTIEDCSIVFMPAGETFLNTTVEIETGATITVTYNCGPDDAWENNSVWLFNCDNDSLMTFCGPESNCIDGSDPDFPLGCGLLWEGLAACEITPLVGTWDWDACDPGMTGSFSVEDQFTSTFTPDSYGIYNLYFYDEFCDDPYEYQIEWNEPPIASLDPDIYDLCFEGTTQISPTFTQSPECTANYEWTANQLSGSNNQPDYSVSSDESFITVNGTGQYETWEFIVEISNGCGSIQDTAWVEVHVDTALELLDETLCDGGTVELDPTPGMPDLSYVWTCAGECDCYDGPYTSPNLDVSCTGTWSVVVSNECWEGEVSADVVVSPGYPEAWNFYTLVECDLDVITQCVDEDIQPIPEDYSWQWFFDGASIGNAECIELTSNGLLSIEVYDPACDITYSDEVDASILDAPAFLPSPSVLDTVTLCPTEVQIFTIGEVFSGNLSWTLFNCDGSELDLGSASTVQLASDMFANDCLGEYQQLVMDYSNSCGVQTETWLVQANACELLIPNIFTPGFDGVNDAFVINGIEAYDRTSLQVFDRWGKLVFSDSTYDNKWAPTDITGGTYYFVLQVFDSTDTMLDEWASYVTIKSK